MDTSPSQEPQKQETTPSLEGVHLPIQTLHKQASAEGEPTSSPAPPTQENSIQLPNVPPPPTSRPKKPHAATLPPPKQTPRSKRQVERVQRRQMAYLQKRREQKKLRVLYKRTRALIRLGFAVLWGFLLWQLVQSPIWTFPTTQFTLKNSQLIRAEHLQPFLTPYHNQPIYQWNPDVVAEQIKQAHPVVDEVHIRRYLFPSRLEVVVVEKKPWAELYATADSPSPYAFISHDYRPIPLQNYQYSHQLYPNRTPTHIILPSSMTLPKTTAQQLDTLSYQLRQIPGFQLQSIEVARPTQVVAHGTPVKLYIGRLDRSITQRLQALPSILKSLETKQLHAIEAIDIRWSEQITLRKKKAIPQAIDPEAKALPIPRPPSPHVR